MLRLVTAIRADERRATWTSFLALLGILAGHTLLETARDALFLTRQPASRLPWVYLAIAVVSLIIFILGGIGGRAAATRRTLAAWLCGSAAVTAGFWILVQRSEIWVLYALYTWSGVFATLVVVRFWTVIGDLFTVSQAKRVFALIGAGSALGSILGAALARVLTGVVSADLLLLVASAVLVVTAFGPVMRLPVAQGPPAAAAQTTDGLGRLFGPFHTIWNRRYLRRVAGIVFVSTIALTLVDFLFKNAVAQNVEPEEIAAFLAGAYTLLNILGLATQLFLVNWLVRTLGVHRVLMVLPGLLMAGALGLVAGGGLVAAYVVKAIDGALRHSLHRTSMEILYVPLTGDLRSRVKSLVDVVGQRGGQALASACILLAVVIVPSATGRGGTLAFVLGAVVLILAALWARMAFAIRDDYLDLFRESLTEVSLDTKVEFPELDLASLETLMARLNSSNDGEVVAVLDLLVDQKRVHVIPALVLYHPSTQVVVHALEIFTAAGRMDFIPITDRLLEHSDPEVRAATLRALAWVAPSPDLYQRFIDDSSATVRTTALIGLASYGTNVSATLEIIDRLARTGSSEERLALSQAILYSPGAGYESALLELAKTPEVSVRLTVAQAMRQILSPRFIPVLLEMLPNRLLRKDARATLVAIGPETQRQLDRALGDFELERRIRRQLPRVLTYFPPREAAEILMRRYSSEVDGSIRYQILRALGRIRDRDPTIPLDYAVLETTALNTLRNLFRILNWKRLLTQATREVPARATPVQELIVGMLEHKQVLTLERIFRVLGLLHPGEDIWGMYRGLLSSNKTLRSGSMELLENLIRPPLQEPLLVAVDDVSDAEKLHRTAHLYDHMEGDYGSLLRSLLETRGVGMRSLVAYHAGELGLGELREMLEQLPDDDHGTVARVVRRSLELLDELEEARRGS